MKVAVVAAFEAGSAYAHAINTVNMAKAFSQLGHEVTLISYGNVFRRHSSETLGQIYGRSATESMKWVQIPRLKLRRYKASEHRAFSWLASPIIRRLMPDLIFARNYVISAKGSQMGIPTAAESHAYVDNRTPPFMQMIEATKQPTFKLLVTISKRLADYYESLGAAPDKLAILATGVDTDRFDRPSQLPLSPYSGDKPNVVYAGHLYDYKGIPTILAAASRLPEINFHLVGGHPSDIARQQIRIRELELQNVILHGLQPPADVPPYLWSADLLLLPPSADHPSANWTSPVKLGEYLASGTPVIATAILALCDWVTDDEVAFIPPDDGDAMANCIRQLLADTKKCQQLVENGVQKAQEFSYRRRVSTIIERCMQS